MALLVDTPKVNAPYDPDKEILEAVDILHEDKDKHPGCGKRRARKADKTLREKSYQRELENENERLKNEVRSLEVKLKPENTEKVKKKSLEKMNAQNENYIVLQCQHKNSQCQSTCYHKRSTSLHTSNSKKRARQLNYSCWHQ